MSNKQSFSKQSGVIVKSDRPLTAEAAAAFWSASIHREPPSLRTTFGNFTTVNSVNRCAFSNSATNDVVILVFWSPTGLSIFRMVDTFIQLEGSFMGSLFNNGAYAVRPLRMSYTLQNVTQMTNVQGEVAILNTDQAINFAVAYPSIATGACSTTTGTVASLISLVTGSPETDSRPAKDYNDHAREVVLPPASYVAYNTYYDYSPSTSTAVVGNLGFITGGDINSIFNTGANVPGVALPYPYTVATTASASKTLGDVPPMRMSVIYLPATTQIQNYVLTLHRQDGVRFPGNTLGASFAKPATPASSTYEDKVLESIRTIGGFPSLNFDTDRMPEFAKQLAGTVLGVAQPFVSMIGGTSPQGMLASTVANIALNQLKAKLNPKPKKKNKS